MQLLLYNPHTWCCFSQQQERCWSRQERRLIVWGRKLAQFAASRHVLVGFVLVLGTGGRPNGSFCFWHDHTLAYSYHAVAIHHAEEQRPQKTLWTRLGRTSSWWISNSDHLGACMLHSQQKRGERLARLLWMWSFLSHVVNVPPQLHKHTQSQKIALYFFSF